MPEENLPSSVSSAVGKSKEAFDAARLNWGWQGEEALEEEIKELEEENGFEGLTEDFEKEVESDSGEDKAAGNSLEVEEPAEGVSGDVVDTLECTDEVRALLGDPLFWIVEREFLFSLYQAKLSGLKAISFSQNRTTRPIRSALVTPFPPTSLLPASLKLSSQLVSSPPLILSRLHPKAKPSTLSLLQYSPTLSPSSKSAFPPTSRYREVNTNWKSRLSLGSIREWSKGLAESVSKYVMSWLSARSKGSSSSIWERKSK